MKTTIEIPDLLYRRAKIRAVRTGSTLRELVLAALETSLNEGLKVDEAPPIFQKSHLGFPVLPARKGVVVTNELINRIREEEGI